MKKIYNLCLLITLLNVSAFAQVGIGTTSPNPSSLLDITSTDKGILIPRIALIQTTNFAPLLSHVAGMQVYNTATVGDVTPGQYYNDGIKWIRVGDAAASSKNYTFLRTSDNLPAETVGDQNINTYRFGNTGFKTNNPTTTIQVGTDHGNNGGVLQINVDDTGTQIQGLKVSNKRTSGFNFGVNGTAYGTGTGTNVGLYGYAENATTNLGLWVQEGNTNLARAAKIGSGTILPNSNAILDLESTDKGLLLPRLALTNTTAFAPLSAHTAGMKAYSTATAGDVSPGEYYNDGAKWIRVADGATSNNYTFLRTSDNLPATTVGDNTVKAYRSGRTLFGNFGTTPDFTMNYPTSPTTNVLSIQQDDFTAAEYNNAASNEFFQAIGYGLNVAPQIAGKTFYGINGGIKVKIGSTVPINLIGGESNVIDNAGTGLITQALNTFAVYNSGNGNITNAKPMYAYTGNFGSGNVTNVASLYGEISNQGTGIISNAKAIEARISQTNPATITNGYGLYVNDIQATNNWGIYQEGANDNNYLAGNTKIGTTPASVIPTAVLEIETTEKGILIPRMTSAQRVAISSNVQGMMVYDTDVDLFYYYSTSNAAWTAMNTGSVKSIATTSYTLLPADSGRVIEFSSATAVTLTVPTNLPVGFQVSISQVGTGIVTFAASGGMVINNRWAATATSGQWAKAGIEVRAINSSILSGDVQ